MMVVAGGNGDESGRQEGRCLEVRGARPGASACGGQCCLRDQTAAHGTGKVEGAYPDDLFLLTMI